MLAMCTRSHPPRKAAELNESSGRKAEIKDNTNTSGSMNTPNAVIR